MNIPLLIIILSLALLLLSALVAVRLIIQSDRKIVGVFMLSAACFMAFRRSLSLSGLLGGDEPEFHLLAELTGCLISLLVLTGFIYLSRLLIALQKEIDERTQAEEVLSRLGSQRELILNSAGEGIYGVDRDGNITFINPAAAEMVGWTAGELIHRPSHEVFHHSRADGSYYPRDECPFHKAVMAGAAHRVNDEVFWRRDGTAFPIEYVSTPMREGDAVVGAVVVFKDISDGKQMEKTLKAAVVSAREEKAKSEAVIAAIGDNLVILNPEFKIMYQNDVDRELIGNHVGEYCYQAFEGREHVCANCPAELSFKDGRVHRAERLAVTKLGRMHLDMTASPLRDASGNIIAVIEMVKDVTERKKAEQVLRRSHDELDVLVKERTAELTMLNEQLRNLSAHTQNARENERTMIAREIHDDLGQSLTALKMDLSLLRKRLPGDLAPAIEKAESMAGLVEAAIQSVKRISMELRPGLLDHLGLAAAIEWQAQEFEKRSGIRCSVDVGPPEVVLDKDRTTAVFRIFQETLTNVARHAGATKISVLLRTQADGLMLQIKDNGKGITESQKSDPKSLGLIGIRERVNTWAGSLAISGSPGKGTTVTVRIPINYAGRMP